MMSKQRGFLTCFFTLLLLIASGASARSVPQKKVAKNVVVDVPPASTTWCPGTLFMFGDSLSDTGNLQLSDPSNPATSLGDPYGVSYFKHPAGRYSDGRLVIDFLAEGLGLPFLPPIQSLLTANNISSKHGVNFAYAGATARAEAVVTPFHLQRQVAQFLDFKLNATGPRSSNNDSAAAVVVPSPQDFDDAMYIIHVGGNDLFYAYSIDGLSPAQVVDTVVPESVAAIVSSISSLYNAGARNFLLFNQPPQGCAPAVLTVMGAPNATRDEYECLADFNMVARVFNQSLHDAIDSLRTRSDHPVEGANIYVGDYYDVNYDIVSNPGSFGFWNDTILRASCGVGEPYNYNPLISCGHNGTLPDGTVVDLRNAATLADPSQLIFWDGVHFTEAFYKIVAQTFLRGDNVTPSLNLTQSCLGAPRAP